VIKFLSILTDASTWLPTSLALPLTLLFFRRYLRLRVKNRVLRTSLIVLAFLPSCIAGWAWIHSRPTLQINDLAVTTTEGNCTATPSRDSGDIKLDSERGPCTIRQVNNQPKTYAEWNRYRINFTMRQLLSTPGTGFEVVDGNGEVRQLLVRQRGFKVGHRWCLEASDRHKNSRTGEIEVQRLNAETCVVLVDRPDRIALTLEYDGSHLHIETKFISDRPQRSGSLGEGQVLSIPHPLIRPEKILALITNVGQNSNDQRGLDGAILSYWWQKRDEK